MSRPRFIAATDARWLARVGTAPDCATGRFPVDFDRLLKGTPFESLFGQSSAAFAFGRNFETACAGPNGSYAPLLTALRDAGIDPGDGGIELFPDSLTDASRAARTRRRIRRMLEGDTGVILLAQAALGFLFAWGQGYVRPDAVVIVPVGGMLHVVEIKGFRIRPGHYPTRKIAGALDQIAVYQVALRRVVAHLGFPPSSVADRVVVVCAARRGMSPIATIHDNDDRRRTFEARLARAETAITASGPRALDRIEALDRTAPAEERLAAFEELARTHGIAFRPPCIGGCGAAPWCRIAALDDPARLGPTRLVAAAGSIRLAHQLASGVPADDPALAPVADRLAAIRRLGEAARADGAARLAAS